MKGQSPLTTETGQSPRAHQRVPADLRHHAGFRRAVRRGSRRRRGGRRDRTTNVTDLINSWDPNLVTYLGDVYAKGTYTEFTNWYGSGSQLFSAFRTKTNPVVGNHEYTSDPTAAGYFRYWNGVPHYYTYEAGGWQFYALDSTSQYNETSPTSGQYKWLKEKLEQAPSDQCSVLYFHHPLYNIGNEGPANRMKDTYRLAAEHRVTLILAGHDHTYQRWRPMDADGNVDPTGVTQVITGNGGHSKMNIPSSDERVAASSRGYGAVRMELYPDRADLDFHIADGTSTTLGDSAHIPCQGLPQDTTAPTAPPAAAAVASRPLGQPTPQVDVTWQASVDDRGVAEYQISRDGQAVASLPTSARSWTDTDVQESTNYDYSVVAVDAWENKSPASAIPAVVTPAPIPVTVSVPASEDTYVKDGATTSYRTSTALRVSAATPSLTTFVKFKVAGLQPDIRSARLQVLANSAGTKGVTVQTVTGSWSDKTLNGTNYQSLVVGSPAIATVSNVTAGWQDIDVTQAVTGNGELSFALTTPGTTQQSYAAIESGSPALLVVDSAPLPDTTPPSVPTGIRATALDESTIEVDWSPAIDPSGVDSYIVYRDGTEIGTVIGTATKFMDTTPNIAQRYTYSISAIDAAGNESAQSAGVSAATSDQTAPDQPENVVAVATSATSIRVVWEKAQDNVGAAGYTIRRDGVEVATTADTSFEEARLTPDTAYEYAVDAFDEAGNRSLPSDPVTVTTPAQTGDTDPPPPPTDVNVTTATTAGEAVITWTASAASDLASYRVYRDRFPVSDDLAAGTIAWNDTALRSATGYTYQVEATDSSGNHSGLSAPVPYDSPDVQAPTVPADVIVTLTGLSAAVQWTAASDDVTVDHYEVLRNSDVVASRVTTTSFTDSELVPSSSYAYSVRAVDPAGNTSAGSSPVTVQTASPVTETLKPTDDLYVSDSAPSTAYPSATTLRIDDLAPQRRSFLRFSGMTQQPNVTKAVLRVFANGTAAKGAAVYTVPTTWSETSTVTWTSQPALGTFIGTTAPSATGGGWIELDVTRYVTSGTPVAFGLTLPNGATTAVAFSSKEGLNGPQLVVTSSP